MENKELKRLIRTGEAAITFLEELARMPRGEKIEINLNMIANHGIAVARLVSAVDQLKKENDELIAITNNQAEELRRLEENEILPVVNERFENFKEHLKNFINEYIDEY